MISLRKRHHRELEGILNSYIVDERELQLGVGSLYLLHKELVGYGSKIENEELINYLDLKLNPYFDLNFAPKVNNKTLKGICEEIKQEIIIG